LTQDDWPSTPPKKILLATDLSGRGDRALDRAAQLAAGWDAELVIVHALDRDGWSGGDYGVPSWRRPQPDAAAAIERQIRQDVAGEGVRLRVHVEQGDPVAVILSAIEREKPDLLVLGAGRPRAWSGGLGRTIDELFRSSPVSGLVVKQRPRGPYRHVLVGTDFTEEAQRGLEVATRLVGDALFAVMHAFEMPYRALLLDSQLSRDFAQMEQDTMRTFVDGADLPADLRVRLVTTIEHGPPEAMLAQYVAEQGADLTVIGAYERSKLFHVVVRGKGPRILESVPSDILVVRPRRPQ
jgi:nucleotide-binding universal stress UspA family protein